MNIAWSHVQKRIALVRLIATFSRDKRDIERGWIRNVRRWKHPFFSSITRRAIPSSIFLYLCLLNSLLLRDFSFFFLNQRLESSVTIFLRNIGNEEGNSITNKRRKNQRTTDSMLRKYTKESVYRNIILFVRPEGRSCRKKIWLPKPRRLGVVPVYCGAARKLSRQFAKTRGEIRNSRAYTSNPIG